MKNVILVLIILAVICGAGLYVYREKKKGKKCIGCPCSGSCSKKNCSK